MTLRGNKSLGIINFTQNGATMLIGLLGGASRTVSALLMQNIRGAPWLAIGESCGVELGKTWVA